MATIGLKNAHTADITEDNNGNETYGTPEYLAASISANLSISFAEGKLNADDKLYEEVKEFSEGTITLNIADLYAATAAKLLGSRLDDNGILVESVEDSARAPFVALGFEAPRSSGKSEYDWFYRVKFSKGSESYQTKSKDGVTFNTPTIEGKIYQRNKALSNGDHPWRAKVVKGESADSATAIAGWFNAVYEPTFTP